MVLTCVDFFFPGTYLPCKSEEDHNIFVENFIKNCSPFWKTSSQIATQIKHTCINLNL